MFVNLGILSFGELLRKFVFSHEFQCLIIHVCRVYKTLKFLVFLKFGLGGTLS